MNCMSRSVNTTCRWEGCVRDPRDNYPKTMGKNGGGAIPEIWVSGVYANRGGGGECLDSRTEALARV